MKSFWLELKSLCKSFKFLAFILVLLSYQAMLVTQFQAQSTAVEIRQLRIDERYESEHAALAVYWQERHNDDSTAGGYVPYSDETIQYNIEWEQYEAKLGEKIVESYKNKDWATYNRYLAEKRFIEWSLHGMMADPTNRYSPYISPEEYFSEDLLKLVERPGFDQLPGYVFERMKTVPPPEQVIFSAALHLNLLKEGLPPVSNNDTSPWGFLFNYLRVGMPKILSLIVLLMTVNILHREKKFGSIKSTLQLPKSRSYYLVRRISLGFLSSTFVVLIPQFLMFVIRGLKTGYRGLNIPVLLDSNFLGLSFHPEHIRLLKWTKNFGVVGLSQYAHSFTQYGAAERMDLIPLWQFLILAGVSLALFVLLFSVVGILVSILVKNEIFAQVTAVGIFALGSIFGKIFPALRTTPWDLFSKANIIPILEGNHYSTYLSSLLGMCIAILILFGLCVLVFRKQDIATG